MSKTQSSGPSLPAFGEQKRSLFKKRSPQSLVTILEPGQGESLPLTIQPAIDGDDVLAWAALEKAKLGSLLAKYGAILLRGFDISTALDFDAVVEKLSEKPLPYVERSSPRSAVQGNIYTSTDYPPDHTIEMHCENSYQKTWPLKILFYCLVPAEDGGATPIADTRRVLARIDPAIKEKFSRLGVLYVRNLGGGFGLPWQTVFQTDDRGTVERYCTESGIQYEWHDGEVLRTRQVRQAIHRHPVTGEEIWFNHALFFHITSLESEAQKVLRSTMAESEWPNNTYFGDGSPIEDSVIEHIRAAFRNETVTRPWQRGDLLMMDNMLAAHGRSSYRGARKILVAMTEPTQG